MKKKLASLILISVFLLFIISSCRKDPDIIIKPNVKSLCSDHCNYLSDLINHRWRLIGDYRDSTAYALNNINLMPLPSTDTNPIDSCNLDDEFYFRIDSSLYNITHYKCSLSEPDTITLANWYFTDNRTKINFNGESYYIYSLTSTEFKIYDFETTTIPGSPTITWLRLFNLQPY